MIGRYIEKINTIEKSNGSSIRRNDFYQRLAYFEVADLTTAVEDQKISWKEGAEPRIMSQVNVAKFTHFNVQKASFSCCSRHEVEDAVT